MAIPLHVGGLLPLTTIDYPDELAAVVFCQGCPWRCRYCHNTQLLTCNQQALISWQQVEAFLTKRQGLLDAVVFSGGEPTMQPALGSAIRTVKALGYKVGLHSSGAYPKRLAEILPIVDWVGLDVKALPEHYPAITQKARSGEKAWQSAQEVIKSGVAHQMRITYHPSLMTEEQKQTIITRLTQMGAHEVVVQPVNTAHALDPQLRARSPQAEPV